MNPKTKEMFLIRCSGKAVCTPSDRTAIERSEIGIIHRLGIICLALVVLGVASNGYADVIGNWEDSTGDGWIDWVSGVSIAVADPSHNAEYIFGETVGATLGSNSLKVVKDGMGASYGQCLAISLSSAQRADFLANNVFAIDYSVAAGTTGGWNEIYQIYMNGPGAGWTEVGGSTPVSHYDFWDGSAERTTTIEIDYTTFRDALSASPDYIQIIFSLNSGSGQTDFYFDNAKFVKPLKAYEPSPSDGETDVSLIPTLSWMPGRMVQDANGHELYFGTDYNDVYDANTSTAGIYMGVTTDASYQVTTVLDGYADYYWRVDEVNDGNEWKGDVWQFTTANSGALTFNKCNVKAGKVQGHDYFRASGTFSSFYPDLNDIGQFDVNIVSADGNVIYAETNNFDVCDVADQIFKYKYKIPRGGEGAITSLKLNFNKRTFVIKAKDVNLTGLACPLRLDITLGDYLMSGEASETVVNGARRIIPTRLMRTYEDTLVVTKAKVRDRSKPYADSLYVRGDVAVEDINDSEPNLVDEDVVVTWGSQTFTIPAGGFTYKSGNLYKCKNIPVAGALMSANINLDKCTFIINARYAELSATSGDVDFGLSFASFDETEEVTVP